MNIMNTTVRTCSLAIALTVVSATSSLAWNSFSPPEDDVLEAVLMGSETLSAGTVISYLPDGARAVIVERTQYFVSGGNWFLPVVNKEGVKFQVVFAPV